MIPAVQYFSRPPLRKYYVNIYIVNYLHSSNDRLSLDLGRGAEIDTNSALLREAGSDAGA